MSIFTVQFWMNIWNAQRNAKISAMHEADFTHQSSEILAYFKHIESQGIWTVYDQNIPDTIFVAMCKRNDAILSLMEKGGELYVTLGDWEKIFFSPSLGFIRQMVDHIEAATDQPDSE